MKKSLQEFVRKNLEGSSPWKKYASRIFFRGCKTGNWKWKPNSNIVRENQMNCLNGILSGFELSHQDKESVAGWMLSEMLEEVPKDT